MDKQRNYEEILSELKNIRSIIKDIENEAVKLEQDGNKAQMTLNDVIGGKVSKSVSDLGKAVKAAVADGEQRVRELEMRVKSDQEEYERIRTLAQSLDEER